jgi:hypothetical protein
MILVYLEEKGSGQSLTSALHSNPLILGGAFLHRNSVKMSSRLQRDNAASLGYDCVRRAFDYDALYPCFYSQVRMSRS